MCSIFASSFIFGCCRKEFAVLKSEREGHFEVFEERKLLWDEGLQKYTFKF